MANGNNSESQAIALGFELEHPDVAQTRFRSSQTLLDYEIVFWDPGWILEEYTRDFTSSYQGLPLISQHDSALIVGEVARRKREMIELLKLGGTIVIFLSRPDQIYIHTGEKQYSGTGRNRHTTAFVRHFDLAAALPISVKLVVAQGKQMEFRGSEPFGSFWRKHKDDFTYRAYMEELTGKPQVYIRRTERPVASVVKAEKGSVILLPDLRYDDDEKKQQKREEAITGSLFDLIAALRGETGDYVPPAWAKDYRLPGEDDAGEVLVKAEQSVSRALDRRAKARTNISDVEQHKLLFTGTGPALEAQVRWGFEALACSVEQPEGDRADLVVRCDEVVGVVEVKGVTKSAKESDAAQLEKWVSAYYEEHGVQPKGILVVNTYCETELQKRTKVDFPQQMLAYSEARQHCLITGVQLLGAALDATANPNRASAIRGSIFECVGVYGDYLDSSAFLSSKSDQTLTEKPQSPK